MSEVIERLFWYCHNKFLRWSILSSGSEIKIKKLSYMYSSSILIGSNRNFNSPQHKLPSFGASTACTSSPSSAITDMVRDNVIWGDNLSSYKKIPSLLTMISLICHIFRDILRKRKLYEACGKLRNIQGFTRFTFHLMLCQNPQFNIR